MIIHRIYKDKRKVIYEARLDGCKYDAVRLIHKRFPIVKRVFPHIKDLIADIEFAKDTFNLRTALIKDDWKSVMEFKVEDKINSEEITAELDLRLLHKLEISIQKAIGRWQREIEHDLARCDVEINHYRGLEAFNAERIRDALVSEIRSLSKEQGFTKVVLGISGGKDSTVAAALCARALGAENVYGVLIPDGEQSDLNDSYEVVKTLGIHRKECNIGKIHEYLRYVASGVTYTDTFQVKITPEADINVGPRLRMTLLREISQSIGARLCGTSNLSESFVGYCTKDGDTSCDFNPLGMLTSKEVVEIGLTMDEIPKHLVLKEPADGLSGSTDEERIGVSYNDIHNYIRDSKFRSLKSDTNKRIEYLHIVSEHKRKPAKRLLSDEKGNLKDKYKYMI